eukprot:gene4855-9679_t
MMRSLLITCMLPEQAFCRKMEAFTHHYGMLIVEFDASLTDYGIIYYRVTQDELDVAQERPVGGFSGSFSALEFGSDSGYQNAAEVFAAVIGIWAARRSGFPSTDIILREDSTAALAWASHSRFKGERRIGNASLVFVLLCLSQKLVVSQTQHLPGTATGKTDALSRVGHPGGMT